VIPVYNEASCIASTLLELIGMHRFVPNLCAMHGACIVQHPVHHRIIG